MYMSAIHGPVYKGHVKTIFVFQYYIISRLIVKICVSKCGNTTPHNAEKRVSRKGCLTLPSDCDFASCFFYIWQHTFSNTVQFSILCLCGLIVVLIHFHKLLILSKAPWKSCLLTWISMALFSNKDCVWVALL